MTDYMLVVYKLNLQANQALNGVLVLVSPAQRHACMLGNLVSRTVLGIKFLREQEVLTLPQVGTGSQKKKQKPCRSQDLASKTDVVNK